MTRDPILGRRVSRLENETDSIYEVIEGFRTEARSRFDGIEATLTGVEAMLSDVARRLDEPS